MKLGIEDYRFENTWERAVEPYLALETTDESGIWYSDGAEFDDEVNAERLMLGIIDGLKRGLHPEITGIRIYDKFENSTLKHTTRELAWNIKEDK